MPTHAALRSTVSFKLHNPHEHVERTKEVRDLAVFVAMDIIKCNEDNEDNEDNDDNEDNEDNEDEDDDEHEEDKYYHEHEEDKHVHEHDDVTFFKQHGLPRAWMPKMEEPPESEVENYAAWLACYNKNLGVFVARWLEGE